MAKKRETREKRDRKEREKRRKEAKTAKKLPKNCQKPAKNTLFLQKNTLFLPKKLPKTVPYPSAIISCARATAASVARKRPPSLKLSGVTLRTPMTNVFWPSRHAWPPTGTTLCTSDLKEGKLGVRKGGKSGEKGGKRDKK